VVPLAGWSSVLLALKSLQPEVAYQLTKALVENKEQLVKGHAALKNFKTEKAWMFHPYNTPLHPGAEKYYRDKGMIK
jgi:TRAP-type uncharacterized transport system substrate-binding protein